MVITQKDIKIDAITAQDCQHCKRVKSLLEGCATTSHNLKVSVLDLGQYNCTAGA